MTGSRAQAVLIGGTFIGVLSALPIISLANICCSWVIGGGVVTAYLLQQGQRPPILLSEGAVAGFLTGVCGAFIYSVVTVPIQLLVAPTQDQIANLFATNADVPPEVLELVEAFSRSGAAVAFFGFVVMLGLGMVFSSLGGVIGAAIFRRDRVNDTAKAPPPSA